MLRKDAGWGGVPIQLKAPRSFVFSPDSSWVEFKTNKKNKSRHKRRKEKHRRKLCKLSDRCLRPISRALFAHRTTKVKPRGFLQIHTQPQPGYGSWMVIFWPSSIIWNSMKTCAILPAVFTLILFPFIRPPKEYFLGGSQEQQKTAVNTVFYLLDTDHCQGLGAHTVRKLITASNWPLLHFFLIFLFLLFGDFSSSVARWFSD